MKKSKIHKILKKCKNLKISRKYKKKQIILDYLISNFVRNTKRWLGDFNDDNYIELTITGKRITKVGEPPKLFDFGPGPVVNTATIAGALNKFILNYTEGDKLAFKCGLDILKKDLLRCHRSFFALKNLSNFYQYDKRESFVKNIFFFLFLFK